MIINLTDYETKALEIEIKKLEKAILETKSKIANLELNKLTYELELIDIGISEEEVINHLIDFVESSDNPKEDLIALIEELDELLKSKEDRPIEDLDKILHYSTIGVSYVNLRIEDYQKELNLLNNELMKLKHKRIELQEKKVDEIATERKYKELLKDE